MERDLPEQFIAMLQEAVGTETASGLIRSLTAEAPSVSVRVNTAKSATVPPTARTVPWEPRGFYLPERPLFAADPSWLFKSVG